MKIDYLFETEKQINITLYELELYLQLSKYIKRDVIVVTFFDDFIEISTLDNRTAIMNEDFNHVSLMFKDFDQILEMNDELYR